MKELMYKMIISPNEGASFNCMYYKTTQKSTINNDIMTYGIEIVKESLNIIEKSRFDDIYVCENKVDELLKSLAHHNVTPITLKDIILDWVN